MAGWRHSDLGQPLHEPRAHRFFRRRASPAQAGDGLRQRAAAAMMGNRAEAAGRHCEEPAGRRSNLMPRVRDCFASLAMTTFAFLSANAAAQEQDADAKTFPTRAIHIVVPFPAGGPSDLVSRLIGQKMTETWGQPVIIDNRPGANTIIGAQAVARAAPDGYTLLMAIDSTLAMNQFMHKNLPYDPFNDFAPITLTTKTVS